ncbi:ataxin-2-like protein isoform X2 [Watersipora subatra]|uniref:ataxin-2-like protein isoform X2 n=1 Tax=Watersipora subatra TaxID=2589382 RepID=UPI00355C0C2A
MSSAAARRNPRSNPQPRSHHVGDTNRGSGSPDYHKSRSQDVEIAGVYKNPSFTFHLTTLVGCTVNVRVQNGKCYEGIFKTFSSELEVVIECAHLVDPDKEDRLPLKTNLIDKLIVSFEDLVCMDAIDADTKYGETDSFTDSAISKAQVNGMSKTRELTPYVLESSDSALERPLEELDSESPWTPEKMFKAHEEKFGGASNFNEENYTTKLPSADSPGFQQKKEAADRMAASIESDSTSRRHAELENGDGRDEESRYSAVSRPHIPTTNRHNLPSRLRDKVPTHSNKALSQSVKVNGRDAHPRSMSDKSKATALPPSYEVAKLKRWNEKFKMENGNSVNPAGPATDQRLTSVESKADPVQSKADPVQSKADPVQSKADPVQSKADPVQSKAHSQAAATPPAPAAITSKADTAATPSPSSPVSSVSVASPLPSADKSVPSAPEVEKKEVKTPKSTLNPEAKEFVCAVKPMAAPAASLPPSQPVQQQPMAPPPQQLSQQQAAYKPSNKTAVVSVLQAPNKNAEIPTAQQAMGSPLTHTPYPPPYLYMSPHPGQRLQRMTSYPGTDSQPGPPHNMQFIQPIGNAPMLTTQQPLGPMPQPQHSQPGHLHQAMIPQSAYPPPGPHTGVPHTGATSQSHHSQTSGFNAAGSYQPGLVPTQGGQQPPGQPPLQPSPHNPSPSPAPMQSSNPAYPFPPASQQFYSAPMVSHAVSQASSYPQHAQPVVYIHQPVAGQFPTMYPPFPMQAYPPNFSGHQ